MRRTPMNLIDCDNHTPITETAESVTLRLVEGVEQYEMTQFWVVALIEHITVQLTGEPRQGIASRGSPASMRGS